MHIMDSQQLDLADDEQRSHDTRFRDVAAAIEFICWTTVLFIPFLRLVNGPAVTTDQFAIQVALTAIAISVAISLRAYQRRRIGDSTTRKNVPPARCGS